MPDLGFFSLIALVLAADLLRYFLGAGTVWLIVNRAFAERLASRRILDARVLPGQVRREIAYSLSTVAIFAATGVLLWSLAANGGLRLYDDAARYGRLWWLCSLGLIVVAHDAWFYWVHRLLHQPWLFATVHARHHASRHPTPWAAYAFHPIEALLQALFLPLYLALVPTHGVVIALFLLHMILRNAIGHCAHELLPWRWSPRGALRWIAPVTHHHFHHARNRGNFGLYFTWWDRCCGTEDRDYLRWGDAQFLGSTQEVRA